MCQNGHYNSKLLFFSDNNSSSGTRSYLELLMDTVSGKLGLVIHISKTVNHLEILWLYSTGYTWREAEKEIHFFIVYRYLYSAYPGAKQTEALSVHFSSSKKASL